MGCQVTRSMSASLACKAGTLVEDGTSGCSEEGAVFGCDGHPDQPDAWLSTEGSDLLVVSGIELHDIAAAQSEASLVTVSVGPNTGPACSIREDPAALICAVPPGVGLGNTIQLWRETEDPSKPRTSVKVLGHCSALNYHPPTITGVSGCKAAGDCERGGGNLLTISGFNFGPENALVFINGNACENATHNATPTGSSCDSNCNRNRQLTCMLPALMTVQPAENSFMVIQSNLESRAAAGMFRYERCSAGQYQNESSAASVGNGKDQGSHYCECGACPAGAYSATLDSRSCSLCAFGKFANATEKSECTECRKGSYADQEGASACTPCREGYSTAGTGATAKVECEMPFKSFDTKLLQAGLLGAGVLVSLGVIYAVYRKSQERFLRVVAKVGSSFGLLVISLCLEASDIGTDILGAIDVLHDDELSNYHVFYMALTTVGTAVGAMAILWQISKGKAVWELMRLKLPSKRLSVSGGDAKPAAEVVRDLEARIAILAKRKRIERKQHKIVVSMRQARMQILTSLAGGLRYMAPNYTYL